MTTAEQAPETFVSTPESHILFMARRADLRLVKTPRYPIYGPSGAKVGEQPGEVVAFRAGVLRVPSDGEAELEDSRKISSADLLEWLEDHRLHDDREDGFWRVELPAPAITQDEVTALTRILGDFDVAKLEAFVQQERAGWARPELLEPAEEALTRLKALVAEQAEKAGADAEKPAKA